MGIVTGSSSTVNLYYTLVSNNYNVIYCTSFPYFTVRRDGWSDSCKDLDWPSSQTPVKSGSRLEDDESWLSGRNLRRVGIVESRGVSEPEGSRSDFLDPPETLLHTPSRWDEGIIPARQNLDQSHFSTETRTGVGRDGTSRRPVEGSRVQVRRRGTESRVWRKSKFQYQSWGRGREIRTLSFVKGLSRTGKPPWGTISSYLGDKGTFPVGCISVEVGRGPEPLTSSRSTTYRLQEVFVRCRSIWVLTETCVRQG